MTNSNEKAEEIAHRALARPGLDGKTFVLEFWKHQCDSAAQ